MRFLWICALAPIALCVCGKARTQDTIQRLDGSRLSPASANRIADEELRRDHVTGAQIAILNRGRTVWMQAFGQRDVQRNLPMTTDTNLWAASITKGIFATWIMQQVEQRRVDLDEPIARILPQPLNEYAAYRSTADELVKDPRWQRVTPRRMLTHSSGLANFSWLEPDHKMHLHFDPGTRFAYSGEGLNILQVALEQRLHEPLEVAMQREIFAPLGMKQTGMVWRPEFDANTALRYDARGGLIGATHHDHARGAGSMTTSVHDLARFTEALLAGRVLRAGTRAEMFRPQIVIHSAHEFPSLDTATGSDGETVGLAYGLGWGLLTRTKFGPAFFKEGHGDGAENYVICFERSQTCMLLLTNSDNGELAFRPLLEQLLGDTVTPWEWEGYTREQVLANEEHAGKHP